ncbi:MAG TPA: hypothetical protein VGB87_22510 [Vicinamibacteria bacterium]
MRLARLVVPTVAIALSPLAAGSASAAVFQIPGSFPTIQAAMDSPRVKDGDTLRVLPGSHAGATVTKAVTIVGWDRRGTGATIVDGPAANAYGNAGFLFAGGGAGSGATIADLAFSNVAFPVFSRGANDVSVTRTAMWGALQGVTSWAGAQYGKGWVITHNSILGLRTSCGGGIGILVGDYRGATVTGNLIAHNEVEGRLRTPAGDCGGYAAPGILLIADYRYPGDTGAVIERNRVTKNHVFLASSEPAIVPVDGIELTDTRNDPALLVIRENEVVYNDLRRLSDPIVLTPDDLATVNRIEANRLGDPFTARGPATAPRSYSRSAAGPPADPKPIR